MNRLLLVALSVLATLALGAPVGAADLVPFKATFHGFAKLPAKPIPSIAGVVHQIDVPLEGEGTHIGAFREDLTHFIDFTTSGFTGFAVFTAADGATFRTVFSGKILGPTPDPADDPKWLTFHVTHTIVAASGRLTGMTGEFIGVDGRYHPDTGEDIGGYVGTISVPSASQQAPKN